MLSAPRAELKETLRGEKRSRLLILSRKICLALGGIIHSWGPGLLAVEIRLGLAGNKNLRQAINEWGDTCNYFSFSLSDCNGRKFHMTRFPLLPRTNLSKPREWNYELEGRARSSNYICEKRKYKSSINAYFRRNLVTVMGHLIMKSCMLYQMISLFPLPFMLWAVL